MESGSRANRPEHCDLLLEAGTLVTLDPSRPVIECGSVAIAGERIITVGTKDEVSVYRSDRVISCRGRLVMPGLVECHNHLFQSLGRTLGEGLPGWEWLSRFMWPYAAEITQEETKAAVYLGAVEAALAGRVDQDEVISEAMARSSELISRIGLTHRAVASSHD